MSKTSGKIVCIQVSLQARDGRLHCSNETVVAFLELPKQGNFFLGHPV